MTVSFRFAPFVVLAGMLAWTSHAGVAALTPRDVTYVEAAPVIAAARGSDADRLERDDLPAVATSWPRWVADRRAAVIARVLRGEEDSLVPLLLFGTSYTAAPRITRAFLERAGAANAERALASAFAPRIDDLLRALTRPGGNERMMWARETLERLGHRLDTADGQAAAGRYLVENFARVSRESGEMAALLRRADSREGASSDRALAFARRGLAPDTAWPINFAVFEALDGLRSSGELQAGSVRRVAIVGPGLDFVDKDEGYDFYPPQTLQPFAIIDTLAALRLSDARTIHVSTFDVNRRVNRHILGLGTMRPASRPYDLQLVRGGDTPWTPEARRYFADVGRRVGRPVPPMKPVGMPGLETRAVRVDPAVLRRVVPTEFDLVYQRLPLAGPDRFDVVVATNVLLYYGRFEQGLAARTIDALLRPDGLLLANTELDAVPGFPLRRVRRTAHAFSTRPGDGEIMFAYRK